MLKTHTVSARPLEHLYLAGDKLVKMRRTGCATAEGLHEQTARRATVRAKTARGIEPYIAKVIRGITAEQRSLKSARRGITQYLGGARAPDQDVANGEAAMGDGQHSATSLRLTRSRKDTAEEDGDLREKEYVKREHNVLSAHPDHWASVDRAESDDDTDLVPALGDSPPTSPNRFIIRLAPSYSVPPNTPSLAPLETSIAFSPCPLQLDLLEPAYAAPVIAGPSACSVTIAWPIHPSSPHADMTRMGVRDVVTADRYMREDMPVADNVRAQLRAGWGRKVAEVQAWLDGMDRRYEWDEWHSAPVSTLRNGRARKLPHGTCLQRVVVVSCVYRLMFSCRASIAIQLSHVKTTSALPSS